LGLSNIITRKYTEESKRKMKPDKYKIISQTDSYKVSQWKVYPDNMTKMFSYLESRGGTSEEITFFGLQYLLKEYMVGPVITRDAINTMEVFFKGHFGRDDVFNKEGWEYILKEHSGYLPISIKAVPEGTTVPVKNILLAVENTDPKCAWLVNYLETLILKVWYPISIATRCRKIRKAILKHLEISGSPETIDFKLVDFGYRGVTTEEQAGIGGLAVLTSFMATDNLAGIIMGMEYYGTQMCGFSIPATEHSVMVAKGREGELEQCKRFLDKYPNGLIACVSDTYNIFECCKNIWGGELKDTIENRNGTLVVRPDSGDFFVVVPKILDILAEKFGFFINSKGYKVLSDKVKIIQGDGMDPETIDLLFAKLVELGWSADNLTVGSGGGLLMENVTRDTHKFAIKASWAEIDGKGVSLFKDPITDNGKSSKKGRLKLVKQLALDGGTQYITVNDAHPLFYDMKDELVEVYRNGHLLVDQTFEEIKNRANQ